MRDSFASNFCRHRDGSWTCISPATFEVQSGRIQVAAGSRFYPGTILMGFDIAEWLEARYVDASLACDESPLSFVQPSYWTKVP